MILLPLLKTLYAKGQCRAFFLAIDADCVLSRDLAVTATITAPLCCEAGAQ